MSQPVILQGELRLPAAFLAGRDLEAVERHLRTAGLLPETVQERRWRLDPEAPGGYVLAFTMVLPAEESHGD